MAETHAKIIAVIGNIPEIEILTSIGYEVVECNTGSDFWGNALNRYRNRHVVVIYSTPAQWIEALVGIRQLVQVADSVRIQCYQKDFTENPERFIKSARSVPSSLLDIPDESYLTMVQPDGDTEIYPAQDFVNGVLSYGVKLNRAPFIVNSDRQLVSFIEAGKQGILLRQKEINISRMTPTAVIGFVTSVSESGEAFPYIDIVNYLKKYIYLPAEELYAALALWVMGTYVFRIFRFYPYLHLNAEKRSGKTLLMELLSPLCFNGVITTNPNVNSVLQHIERDSATLFYDESEGLSKEHAGGKVELMSVLKTGFSSGGKVTRANTMYSTFSPKCFAGINEIDDVLADRAITIRMMRKTDKERLELYRETPIMLRYQSELRDRLYLFGLQYGTRIAAAYNRSDGHYDKLPHLTNRAFDIWIPLFKVAEMIPDSDMRNGAFDALDKYSQLDVKKKIRRDTEDNDSTSLLEALGEMKKELKPLRTEGRIEYYDTDSVHFFLQKAGFLPRGMQKKALSRLLKQTLDIESVPKSFDGLTKRLYAIDLDLFAEYHRRYLSTTVETKV